ncbi:hypothetical protein F3Y22_tig00000477pilonHSYRG00472 [Hibiscus syriacus]|uniref:Reverse transcriptase domain-containing protein n=1 Tax=Hibiscus syriacus TaxID=106335 RepID=A0A6A3D0X8_HIBSY|nr:hypothetical protein F3Y22_tig00000477pilonHSYRG00472 [Hibiscus syriacus]
MGFHPRFAHDVGFPVSTIRVIMHCITLASMQIQLNGEYTPDFKPQRGIRQVDPLSPYLFVLAMERLGHSIRKCVEEGDWKGFSFARQGLPISHLFFADDLMLYAKADLPHTRQIEKILNHFGHFSGHKVSKRKTHIYFSPNTVTETKTVILSCLGFQEVDHMGKYLSVSVLHSHMKTVDFDFIFDKFRAIPTYFMQVMSFLKKVCDEIESATRHFIWGSEPSGRKISLVNWPTVCTPIDRGGLGLILPLEQNKAFLMKLGYSIMVKRTSYWVQLLRQKYKIQDAYPLSIERHICTPLWRGIAKTWSQLSSCLVWSVENRDTINFWNDAWVTHLGPLYSYARANAHVHPTQKLHNFIDEQNHWDIEALSQVLIPVSIPHVLNFRPPEATDISDALVWKWDPELHFTIKSTYTFLIEDKKIMTNYESGRRMLTNDCSCATCGATMESVIHVLRDCPPSQNLWLRVVPHSAFASFFGTNLQSWITQNIQKQQPVSDGDPPWSSFFTALIWHIWKQKNDYVFKGATYKIDSTIHSSYNWAKCYANSSKVPVIYPIQHVTNPTWSPPPRGWMCLNMDSAVATFDGRGSIGGVIRNSNGEWIICFTKNIGTTSILHAELWSIYEGLLIARNLDIHRLWIQFDCSRAVKLVGESGSMDNHISLLRAILKLLQSGCWVTKIQWISRN